MGSSSSPTVVVTGPAPLPIKILCILESILTVSLISVVISAFCRLMDIRPLHDAMSSVSFPRHRKFMEDESPFEKDWFEWILNLEIIVLLLIQTSLSGLLIVGVQKNSGVTYKIWIAVHLLFTVLILLPVGYQYVILTCDDPRSKGFSERVIILFWILYRLLSFLMIGTFWLENRVTKAYVNF